ncbi:MAG: PorT family protein [Bacteroidales bacterium]|nr:PorT family protein [Bacteroidales bacterium]HPD95596.1 hypothetical protein [Tenuifilaceae bacterium]HRX31862.1 hypothetical protein [Tenuifilaceae bacterium]
MKKYILFIAFVLVSFLGKSQTTCTDKLRQAERNFDEGQLDDIPQMVESCMKNGFTKEEKKNAYKLLIQTHLFNEKMDLADAVMKRFLKEYPSYEIAVNDPKEFVNLYKTYRTDPIFKLEFCAGVNYSLPFVKETYSPENLNQNAISYNSLPGFDVGATFTFNIAKNFNGSIGAIFSNYRLDYLDEGYDYTKVSGTFSNYYIGLPLSASYNLTYKGIKSIFKAGIETSYLISSKMNFTKSFTNGDNPIKSVEDISDYFKKIDIRPTLSVGVIIKVDKYEIIPSVGVKFSTIVPLIDSERLQDPSNSDLYYQYNYTPDKIFMNQVFFSISFMKPVYNPQKIK